MKKIFVFITLVAITMAGMTSCLDGSGSDATISYIGTCDSIEYSDSSCAVFDKFIKEAVTFTFEEKAQSDESSAFAAIAMCHEQACATWERTMKILSKDQVANTIFKNHSDTLSRYMGIENSTQLNNLLKPMKLKTKVYNGNDGGLIYKYTKELN